MTTFEFLTRLTKIEEVFAEDGKVENWIISVANLLSVADNLTFMAASTGSDDAWKRVNALNNTVAKHIAFIREMRPGKVFVTLARWIDELRQCELSFDPELRGVVEGVAEEVQDFYDSYDSFVSAHRLEDAVVLIESAKTLIQTKSVALGIISLTRSSLLPKPKVLNGNSELSLFLSADIRYEAMLAKLSALHEIYSELCRLMGISTSEFPLQIVRIEAGSLWAVLVGESGIIKLMTSMIESSVSYMHRNFTREGKLQAIPRNAEAIDSLLNLSEKLEANGIDNTVLKDNIRQSAVILGKDLNSLLVGEPVVKVDGRTHSIGEEWEKRFLEGPRTLFLESGSETEDNPGEQ